MGELFSCFFLNLFANNTNVSVSNQHVHRWEQHCWAALIIAPVASSNSDHFRKWVSWLHTTWPSDSGLRRRWDNSRGRGLLLVFALKHKVHAAAWKGNMVAASQRWAYLIWSKKDIFSFFLKMYMSSFFFYFFFGVTSCAPLYASYCSWWRHSMDGEGFRDARERHCGCSPW